MVLASHLVLTVPEDMSETEKLAWALQTRLQNYMQVCTLLPLDSTEDLLNMVSVLRLSSSIKHMLSLADIQKASEELEQQRCLQNQLCNGIKTATKDSLGICLV